VTVVPTVFVTGATGFEGDEPEPDPPPDVEPPEAAPEPPGEATGVLGVEPPLGRRAAGRRPAGL
jgi:hypothetical protein